MNNTTDLTEEILTSNKARRIIGYVTPGYYAESYVGLWLFQIIGKAIDDPADIISAIKNEIMPQTADWSLPYWESEFGIVPAPGTSEKQRQRELLNYLQNRLPLNPYRMKKRLEEISGCKVEMIENISKNTFKVDVIGYTINLEEVRKEIDRLKPAHLVYELKMAEREEARMDIYTALRASEHEKYATIHIGGMENG